jgi:hypothetical protein
MQAYPASIAHTEKEHLDLVPLHHLVALQLVLNLLMSGLPLLLFCAHSATHLESLVLLVNKDRKSSRVRVRVRGMDP